MRSTKIVCTIGPASSDPKQLEALIRAGMNVARINMSHGAQEQHREVIQHLKALSKTCGSADQPCVSILMDTQGAEIRTGDRAAPLQVTADQIVIFSPHPLENAAHEVIQVNYDHFSKVAGTADQILLDNGELTFDFLSVEGETVLAKAQDAGSIGSRRHVNLPGADLDLDPITEKDWQDIKFAIDEDLDFIALSFVQTGNDVQRVKDFLDSHGSSIQVLAKIETRQGVDNLADILRVADGIMVARGDLGAEVPFERVPVIQDDIVSACREASKPVIVATHMLESMIENPMPTRAEVTDIAHAATTRADATMLSGETAAGKHVVASLKAMDRVLRATEDHLARAESMEELGIHNNREARAEAAVTLATSTDAAALVVVTRSGKTARDVCKYRPIRPIFSFSPDEHIQRHMHLSYGILPFVLDFDADPEKTVQRAMKMLKELSLVQKGDDVIVVADARANDVDIHTIQVRTIA